MTINVKASNENDKETCAECNPKEIRKKCVLYSNYLDLPINNTLISSFDKISLER